METSDARPDVQVLAQFKDEHDVALRGMFSYGEHGELELSLAQEVVTWLLHEKIDPLSVIDMFQEYAISAGREFQLVEPAVRRVIDHEQMIYDIETSVVAQYHSMVKAFIQLQVDQLYPRLREGTISYDELLALTIDIFNLRSMEVDLEAARNILDEQLRSLRSKK